MSQLPPGIDAIESRVCTRGTGLYMPAENVMFFHPLDLIAVTTPDLLERLDKTIDWIIEEGWRKTRRLQDQLVRDGQSDRNILWEI